MMQFQAVPEIYARVYQAIDATLAMGTGLPSTEATVQRALIQFRNDHGDPEALEHLEAMSTLLHSMLVASLKGSAAERTHCRQQLSILANEWIGRLPIH